MTDQITGQPRSRDRRRTAAVIVAAVAVVAALVAGTAAVGVTVLHRSGQHTAAVANRRPAKLPAAAPPSPVTVAGPGGSTVACPVGAKPGIMLTGASFSPKLVNGSLLGKGRYQIRLRGTVDNETTHAIVVHGVTATVRGQPWTARVSVATSVPAQSSVEVGIEGTYQSQQAGVPNIHTELAWTWQTTDLQPCGDLGLIEDS
jgi:hypothetical protein